MPLITVAMPAYNSADYIGEAIDGILNQTHRDFELIIVNDGSTDNTESIIQSYADPRIQYHANDRNLGHAATRNRLIHLAQGEYLANADSDDISHPERLAIQADYLDRHPDIAGVSANITAFTDHAAPPFTAIPDRARHTVSQTAGQTRSRVFFTGQIIPDPAAMFRTAVFAEHNTYYDPNVTRAADYDLYIRLAFAADLVQLKPSLLAYRQHSANSSAHADTPCYVRDARERFYRAVLGVDLTGVFNDRNEIADLPAFRKFADAAEIIVDKFADDPRFDRAELHYRAAGKLYGQLRQLEKAGHDFADIYDAYRRSKLLRNIRLSRRVRMHAKGMLRRVGLYR